MQNEIVILEDNAERRQHMLARLRDRFPPFPVTFFPAAAPAIAYLQDHLRSVRLTCLDHDLEPEKPTDPDPGTGRDVSDFLASQTPVCPVIIHSTNTHASLAMEADLTEHGWSVQRVTPYEGIAWVDREWFWAVREALLQRSSDSGLAIAPETLQAAQEFIARAGGYTQARAAVDHLAGIAAAQPK
jgi:hypothetical protein